MKKILGILLTLNLFVATGLSYGNRGHGLVGAIADQRVANNTSLQTKISGLLDGLTLQRVATLQTRLRILTRTRTGFICRAIRNLRISCGNFLKQIRSLRTARTIRQASRRIMSFTTLMSQFSRMSNIRREV